MSPIAETNSAGAEAAGLERMHIDCKDEWLTAVRKMEAGSGPVALELFGGDPDALFNQVRLAFNWMPAAGGLVRNNNNEVLMIFRRGHWDLPKGKLDEGESLSECAGREVEEETGQSVVVGDLITKTYHIYQQKKQFFLKCTYWFEMIPSKPQYLKPQTEEDIEQVCWVGPAALTEKLNNTYKNIIQVVEAAAEKSLEKLSESDQTPT